MPERKRRGRYDPDERFSLHPLDPVEGLKKLLGVTDPDDEGVVTPDEEDEDS